VVFVHVALGVALAACAGPGPVERLPSPSRDRRTTSEDIPPEEEEPPLEATPGPATPADGTIYANTPSALYRFSPATKGLTKVGDFGCLQAGEEVTDIAVDKSGDMFAVAFTATGSMFLSIDPVDASCAVIHRIDAASSTEPAYPVSLAFVPAGTIDPNAEVLVGYARELAQSYYVKIDRTTGAQLDIGGLHQAPSYPTAISGDLVAVQGGKAYLSAYRQDKTQKRTEVQDILLEFDPATGRVVREVGGTGHADIWGLAFWAGKAYGFTSDAKVLEIDVQSGTSNVVAGLPSGMRFWGAAVSTQAPTAP
jgi:hypothetical protein